MSIKKYLKVTEPAVRLLFKGLNSYDSNKPHSIAQYMDQSGLIRMSKQQNAYEKYYVLEFSKATLSGSILQIAFMAIKKFSTSGNVTRQCKLFGVKTNSYCVGREVHNIPIGLLIYAGRIQYNHWDEGKLTNPVVRKVFDHLYSTYNDDQSFDMAYDLNYPQPRPVSHYIVRHELNWKTMDDYSKDMNDIFN